MKALEVKNDIYWVGALDPDLRTLMLLKAVKRQLYLIQLKLNFSMSTLKD